MQRSKPLPRKPMRRSWRNTGPDSTTVDLILERAQYSCEACSVALGAWRGADWSVQHRRPRAMGGTNWSGINLPSNLLVLCGSATTPGSCHHFAEHWRASSVASGWLVLSRVDPATVPVLIDRGSRFVYLTNDGRYSDDPEVAA